MGGLKYIPLFHLSPPGTDKQRKANLQIAGDPGPSVSQSNTTEDIGIITQGLPICQCRASSSPHTSSSAVWDRPHASRWMPRAEIKEEQVLRLRFLLLSISGEVALEFLALSASDAFDHRYFFSTRPHRKLLYSEKVSNKQLSRVCALYDLD